MKRPHYCTSCWKVTIKRLALPVFISGFVTFLLFMSLTPNNYNWVTKNLVISDNYLPSFRIVDSGERPPRETPQYKYLLNEADKCEQAAPYLLLLISVQARQTDARQAIRQTWGKEDFLAGVNVRRLFLLGKEARTDPDLEQKLLSESRQYRDIIQNDYLDTYNNLTLKTLIGLEWVVRYCPQASYIMKTDSDMFVNTEYLVHTLLKPDQPPKTNYFTGYIMSGYAPNRNKESKWYMSPELYAGELYPVFCSGTGYVFSTDLAQKILNISGTMRILHLEDVFIAICLDKLGLSPVPPPKVSDFNHWKVSYSPCVYNQLVTSHQFQPQELITYWDDLQQNKHKCS